VAADNWPDLGIPDSIARASKREQEDPWKWWMDKHYPKQHMYSDYAFFRSKNPWTLTEEEKKEAEDQWNKKYVLKKEKTNELSS